MYRLVTLAAAGALMVSGCASQIMSNYVGGPLVNPMLDYGQPVQAFDVGGDRRAFVWVLKETGVASGYSYSTGSSSGQAYGTSFGNTATVTGSSIFNAQTTYVPPRQFTNTCRYTLFATPNTPEASGPADWTVVDYRKPSFKCE